jgi:hypothetical protein
MEEEHPMIYEGIMMDLRMIAGVVVFDPPR